VDNFAGSVKAWLQIEKAASGSPVTSGSLFTLWKEARLAPGVLYTQGREQSGYRGTRIHC
jgi:hypothetical protein